mgnify:FL=1
MIVQLESKRALKSELESIWVRLNDLKVAMFYIDGNRSAVTDAQNLVNNPDRDSRLKKLIESVADLSEWMSCMPFDELEESITSVQETIDHEYFSGTSFKKHSEAKDEDMDEDDEEDDEE